MCNLDPEGRHTRRVFWDGKLEDLQFLYSKGGPLLPAPAKDIMSACGKALIRDCMPPYNTEGMIHHS